MANAVYRQHGAISAPQWRQNGEKLGKRVMTLSDRFLAPNFDVLAPKQRFWRQPLAPIKNTGAKKPFGATFIGAKAVFGAAF